MRNDTVLVSKIMKQRSVDGVQSRMIRVGPELAEYLLTLNTHNRKQSAAVVRKYATEIHNGEWYPNASGIGIDVNNVLTDGQTRLAAIIESGIEVPLLVVWGLPPESQEKCDRQRRRTLSDVFYLSGIEKNKKIVQVATFLAIREMNTGGIKWGSGGGSVADSEVKIQLGNHRLALSALAEMGALGSSKGIHAVGVGAALVLMHEISPQKARDFWSGLHEPVICKSPNDPRYRLWKYLTGDYRSKGNAKGSGLQWSDFNKSIYAMNAYLHEREISQVRDLDKYETEDLELVAV